MARKRPTDEAMAAMQAGREKYVAEKRDRRAQSIMVGPYTVAYVDDFNWSITRPPRPPDEGREVRYYPTLPDALFALHRTMSGDKLLTEAVAAIRAAHADIRQAVEELKALMPQSNPHGLASAENASSPK